MSPQKARRSLLDPADSRWDQQVTLEHAKPEPYTFTHFNRDDLRGQLRSLRLLEQLLERCRREDLPAVTWTVTAHSVSGELSKIGGGSPDRLRAAFMAWVDALGLKWREHRRDGSVELAGATKLPGIGGESHLEVGVGLRARWWEVDEDTESVIVPTDTAGQPE